MISKEERLAALTMQRDRLMRDAEKMTERIERIKDEVEINHCLCGNRAEWISRDGGYVSCTGCDMRTKPGPNKLYTIEQWNRVMVPDAVKHSCETCELWSGTRPSMCIICSHHPCNERIKNSAIQHSLTDNWRKK